jgi:hypothetical protein
MRKEEPKFQAGEVVRIITEWYSRKKDHGNERYQRITQVFPWTFRVQSKSAPQMETFFTKGFGYRLLNGDECHEKFLAKLTSRELGASKASKEKR